MNQQVKYQEIANNNHSFLKSNLLGLVLDICQQNVKNTNIRREKQMMISQINLY
jgi:hypothetical protein